MRLKDLLMTTEGPNKQSLALAQAVVDNNAAEVERLLQEKVDPNTELESPKISLLMYVASKGYAEVIKLLIKFGAKIDLKDKYGNTALMYAASIGQEDIVNILINNKANVKIKNDNGGTALTCAANNGNYNVVQSLCKHESEVNHQDKKVGQHLLLQHTQATMMLLVC